MRDTRHLTAAERERRAAATTALVRRVVEDACNQGNLAVLDEVLAPPSGAGGTEQDSTRTEAASGVPARQDLCAWLAAFREAVPDARWTILEQVAEGETVVTRLVVTGSFSGPLLGLAPPGRPAVLTGVAISRFVGGRLVGLSLHADLLGLLEQLGVMPQLNLTQAMTMARVLQVGALLAEEAAPVPPRSPPPSRVRAGV